MRLTEGLKITKLDNIIDGILFVAVIAIPVHFAMTGWQMLAMYSVAAMAVMGCWRLSYLRSKRNEKTAS